MTWYRHDTQAHLDEKMIVLRKRHGWEGIGVYWLLVSLCYEDGGSIPAYKLPIIFEANEIAQGDAIFATMVKLRLFQAEPGGESYFSERVSKELAKEEEWRKIRSEAGRVGGQASAEARKKAKKPTTVEQPSSSRERTSTISTTDRTIPTDLTLPSQPALKKDDDTTRNPQAKTEQPNRVEDKGTPERKTDEQIAQEFHDAVIREQWCDVHYADKTIKQLNELSTENRIECYRKMRVMMNAYRSKGDATRKLAHKMYGEIAGFVNDRGAMEKQLSGKEVAKRRDFAETESGKHYVKSELDGSASNQEWE